MNFWIPQKSTCLSLILLVLPISMYSQWLTFQDSTISRLTMVTYSNLDEKEKDLAVGDMDKNGFVDLIIVRKQPFSSPGAEGDILMMNYDGVLVDSTAIFAPGFISTPTDARDVIIEDFDGDSWLDVVVCNTFEQQPVYYHNLGLDGSGNWLGLADSSSSRLPTLTVDPLQFCAVWAGDVTGNGAPDLYFSNYAPSGGCEDVLLINDGNGSFTDESMTRLGNLRTSAFGTSVEIHDMDNDGDQDIIKISTLYSVFPWNDNGVFLLFNDGTGNFSNWVSVTESTAAPYMFTVTDFDHDGTNDLYIVDDGQDYIRMGTVVTPDTSMTFTTSAITDPRTTGFGGNCKLADLDCDGALDLGICDVDVDIPPCESGNVNRKFSLMKNVNGVLQPPYGTGDSIWNKSAFDFAFLDIDNNGTTDIVQGRCVRYAVLLNTGQVLPCSDYSSSRVYVDSSATGNGDGTSWVNAFPSVQQALYAAANCVGIDSVFIAKGTYLPCGDNRRVSFLIPDGTSLLGGFPGGGGTLAMRDPDVNLTILTGDIGEPGIFSDNSFHVVSVNSGATCQLNGLTIANGKADGAGTLGYGAGIFSSGNVHLVNIKMIGHSGEAAGYVIHNSGTLNFDACILEAESGNPEIPVVSAFGTIQVEGLTVVK